MTRLRLHVVALLLLSITALTACSNTADVGQTGSQVATSENGTGYGKPKPKFFLECYPALKVKKKEVGSAVLYTHPGAEPSPIRTFLTAVETQDDGLIRLTAPSLLIEFSPERTENLFWRARITYANEPRYEIDCGYDP